MKNITKIGIGVGVGVGIVFLFVGLNLYSISNLQFRGHNFNSIDFSKFDLADASMDFQLEACNPTFFPASFKNLKVDIAYKSTSFGTLTVWGKTVPPNSASVVDGRLKVNAVAMAGLFLELMKAEFSHTKPNVDPNELRYIATLDAPVLGVIPFSLSKTYLPTEFFDMLQGQGNAYSC